CTGRRCNSSGSGNDTRRCERRDSDYKCRSSEPICRLGTVAKHSGIAGLCAGYCPEVVIRNVYPIRVRSYPNWVQRARFDNALTPLRRLRRNLAILLDCLIKGLLRLLLLVLGDAGAADAPELLDRLRAPQGTPP